MFSGSILYLTCGGQAGSCNNVGKIRRQEPGNIWGCCLRQVTIVYICSMFMYRYPVHYVHCSCTGILYTMFNVHVPVSCTLCSMFMYRYPVHNVQCSCTGILYTMFNVHVTVSCTLCSRKLCSCFWYIVHLYYLNAILVFCTKRTFLCNACLVSIQ